MVEYINSNKQQKEELLFLANDITQSFVSREYELIIHGILP